MKVLVTGATGFVGNHVAQALAGRGAAVRVLARSGSPHLTRLNTGWELVLGDVQDPASVREAVRGCDAVFHVAARYSFWPTGVRSYYATNVVGTRNVLQAALEAGVKRVVHTSSWVTVGKNRSGGLSTEADTPSRSELRGAYRWTKYLAEQEALGYAAKGLNVVVVNPTVPVGPGDARPTPTGRLVVDFLRRRLPAFVDVQLNLVGVEDVAEGHVLAWEKGRAGERYLLGCSNMTLGQMLGVLARQTGIRAPRLRLPQPLVLAAAYADNAIEGGLLRREPRIPLEGVLHAGRRVQVDCRKATQELGFQPTSVEEALLRAVNWYRQNGYANERR
ncbi:MAG: NAD-dependent epimerase/dehydratase family protein [Dehalococcoidia bacterium]|nr:NAD-dependent epimerase/dehydratase family protein [Dehalococcoidia bacterium]